jgi:malonyl-CoA/methylmalonyl-CoA synthetase
VLKPGVEVDLSKIDIAISDQLARFKHPKKLIILDELPRNTMGKIQKNMLRENYKDVFARI